MKEIYGQIDAIIFSGGEHVPKKYTQAITQQNKIVIAADSGLLEAQAHGFKVDYAVGDFDSLPDNKLLDNVNINAVQRFPKHKDDSDTSLALQLAYQLGCCAPLLIGGGGLRMDHSLANLSLLCAGYGPVQWLTAHELLIVIKNNFSMEIGKNRTVSFYPLMMPIECITAGLKWPLDRINWCKMPMSLSNETVVNSVDITMKNGQLVMILPHQDQDDIKEIMI